MVEPSLDKMVAWTIEEIPRNATIYYDLNGDGRPDVVFSHPVIAQDLADKCQGNNESRISEDYIVLSTCPSDKAFNYFVTKRFALFREISQKLWNRIFMMVQAEGNYVRRNN
jgi:hypothetical protein